MTPNIGALFSESLTYVLPRPAISLDPRRWGRRVFEHSRSRTLRLLALLDLTLDDRKTLPSMIREPYASGV